MENTKWIFAERDTECVGVVKKTKEATKTFCRVQLFLHFCILQVYERKIMEKIKHYFLKSYSAVLVALLGVFGFSCSPNNDGYGVPMYGAPLAHFVVKGVVENKTERQGIADIQVEILSVSIAPNGNKRMFEAIGTTNQDGTFKVRGYGSAGLPINSRARFIDENGVFAEKIKKFDWEDAEQTRPASGFSFQGEFTKTLDTVLLTLKADEDCEEENN